MGKTEIIQKKETVYCPESSCEHHNMKEESGCQIKDSHEIQHCEKIKQIQISFPETQKIIIDVNEPLTIMAYMVQSKTLTIEQMEKIMDLRDRMEKEKAYKSFLQALSKFQAECPEIEKNTPVKNKDGTLRYKYAKIGQIVKQIKKALHNNSLSYFFDYQTGKEQKTREIVEKGQKRTEKYIEYFVNVICHICHVDGYEKISSPVKVPIDESQYMTDIQKIGTAHSYGDRYSLSAALGIVTQDEDMDGNKSIKNIGNQDTPENQWLYRRAIIGLLTDPIFTNKDRERFKMMCKSRRFKKLFDYQTVYKEYLAAKKKREAKKQNKTESVKKVEIDQDMEEAGKIFDEPEISQEGYDGKVY